MLRARRERAAARARRLPVRAGQRGVRVRRRRRWTAAFSATWEGGRAADARVRQLPRARRRRRGRRLHAEPARPPGGRRAGAAPATPLARLVHALDAVQRLGRDPAGATCGSRTTATTTESSTARSSSGGSTPGEAPRLYTADEGWQTVQGLGHGHRQPGPDRRRLAGGLPDQPGRQQAADPGRRARPAALRGHRGRRGATAHEPFAGDTSLPSTGWHAEFEDVNNDGIIDLYVAKGNVEAMPDYAAKDPSNLLLGQPDGTFVEGAEEAGIVTFARARAARHSPTSTSTGCSTWSRSTAARTSTCGGTSGGTADDPAAMGNWLGVRLDQDGPNHDAIGPGWRSGPATDRPCAR